MTGEDNGRLYAEFERALRNSVAHTKRSLLDFADYQATQLPPELAQDPRLKNLIEFFKRRVHNDVSMIESQVLAAFEICKSGGVIPPFGRSERELAGAGANGQGARH